MKKKILFSLALSNVLFYRTFAATGNASDGLEGVFAIIGFVLLVAGLLYLYDYLKKNGRRVVMNVFAFSKKIIIALITLLCKTRSEFHHPLYLSKWKI